MNWSINNQSPLPPKNLEVTSPYRLGVLDLRWDDPASLGLNSAFQLVGVNIYRSEGSDKGPFVRLNTTPIGGRFYRDQTQIQRISQEVVSWPNSWSMRGDGPNRNSWVFRTKHPLVKKEFTAPNQRPTNANLPSDVVFRVNGEEIPVHSVQGSKCEVTLINTSHFDPTTEELQQPLLPSASDTIDVSYHTVNNHVKSGLDINVWYRVTSVSLNDEGTGYIETPLEWCEPKSVMQVENLDYIWREAMARNAWILQMGGERVKFFVRKTSGCPCSCGLDEVTLEYTKQPWSLCEVCYGTGFVKGYEGPYEGIIAPDDAERRIVQALSGRYKEHTYEVWMGVSPQLTQRDFIVKQTNERYGVGAVRRPSNRGNYMQQHFSIKYLDEGDIRYKVPMDGTESLPWPQTRGQGVGDKANRVFSPRPVDGALEGEPQWPVGPENTHPMQTEKDNIPDEREHRGRTRVWEDQMYVIFWFVFFSSLWGGYVL